MSDPHDHRRARRRYTTAAVAAALHLLAAAFAPVAAAQSQVFAGDPVDGGTGLPYEILPGQPLVTPGADGRLGTADDIVNGAVVGDVDLVVRLGSVPGGGAIPDPAVRRGAVALAVAGPRGAGSAVPFTVYLSDGAVTPAAPYGAALAAADMDGLPVVVLVFADRDGDGLIGPSRGGAAKTRPARQVRALAELEPVGREVALFAGGVASGTVVVDAGGPPSAGGVTLVATALAFTGSYDPGFLEGFVPSGPGISSAQPFLVERDPARLFSTDLGDLEAGGTLNPEPQAAGIPLPGGVLDLALPADGTSPTVDTALAVAGAPVCARLVERARSRRGIAPAPDALVLGTAGGAGRLRLDVVAVDRLGNPTDPPPGLVARVTITGPFALKPAANGGAQDETLEIKSARGKSLTLQATGPGTGTVRVSVGGVTCQTLDVGSRPERNRGGADAVVAPVGRADFTTITAAAAAAVDRNGDGRVTIEVAEGLYREAVRVDRAVELRGAGQGRTVIDARGSGPALTLAHAAALVADLTASGGTVGVSVESALVVRGLEARANVGAGVALAVDGASAERCVARANGGAGFALSAPASVNASLTARNGAAGVLATTTGSALVADVTAVGNGGDGIEIVGGTAPVVDANRSAGNLGTGITLEETTGGVVSANQAAGNDGNGLRLNDAVGAVVDGNDFSANGGFGMRLSTSSADFDAAPGTQVPPGSNDVSGNRKGPLEID